MWVSCWVLKRMGLAASILMFRPRSSSSRSTYLSVVKVQLQAVDVLSIRRSPGKAERLDVGPSAARRLQDFARRDASNRMAALSNGRAEAASSRRGRHSSSVMLPREDARKVRRRRKRSHRFVSQLCRNCSRTKFLGLLHNRQLHFLLVCTR